MRRGLRFDGTEAESGSARCMQLCSSCIQRAPPNQLSEGVNEQWLVSAIARHGGCFFDIKHGQCGGFTHPDRLSCRSRSS